MEFIESVGIFNIAARDEKGEIQIVPFPLRATGIMILGDEARVPANFCHICCLHTRKK